MRNFYRHFLLKKVVHTLILLILIFQLMPATAAGTVTASNTSTTNTGLTKTSFIIGKTYHGFKLEQVKNLSEIASTVRIFIQIGRAHV